MIHPQMVHANFYPSLHFYKVVENGLEITPHNLKQAFNSTLFLQAGLTLDPYKDSNILILTHTGPILHKSTVPNT
jgi:xanthine dehydrogenase molybdopterin-binding subunit B